MKDFRTKRGLIVSLLITVTRSTLCEKSKFEIIGSVVSKKNDETVDRVE